MKRLVSSSLALLLLLGLTQTKVIAATPANRQIWLLRGLQGITSGWPERFRGNI